MLTAILTVVLFMMLIIPHEMGHLLSAKLCGIQVNEFSMGMGPALVQKQRGETLYSVRLVPLGGFCAMEGENEVSNNPRAFSNKKGWQKMIVLFAGAAMNILVANLVMIIAFTAAGEAINTIEAVSENGPAYVAGIEVGDKIIKIGDTRVKTWGDTVEAISKSTVGDELPIVVNRNGEEMLFNVTPEIKNDRIIVGIQAKLTHNPFLCAPGGISATWNIFKAEIAGFKMLFSGRLSKDDVSGPVGMISLVNETRHQGPTSFLFLVSLISLNLAIINLLPLPSLDGGRIIFVIIRKITGNMISDELEGKIHLIGISLLIMLFVFITWNDIMRLIGR